MLSLIILVGTPSAERSRESIRLALYAHVAHEAANL